MILAFFVSWAHCLCVFFVCMLFVKRWYKERRAARTFHRFLEMIRDMVRRRTQAAYLQRGRR